MTMNILALIPARGGSKSIPLKNIKPFNGQPLIAYSIAAARQSAHINRVVCSTDHEEIAACATAYGAEVPFTRPGDLALDDTTDLPVFEHALSFFAERKEHFDLVIHLRPTSPLREPGMIDRAIDLILSHPHADSLRSVSPPAENPFKMWVENDDYLTPLIKSEIEEAYNQPRQHLPETLWHNGVLDIIRPECIMQKRSMSGDRILPFRIPAPYAIDLDEEWQWLHAELWMQHFPLDLVRI